MAAVTRDAAASKGIDVDSIGLNLPRAGAMSAEGDDSFSSSNGDTTNEPANSDSSETDSDSSARRIDLALLQTSISGHSSYAALLSRAPVCSVAEVDLIMKLTPEHIKKKRGKNMSITCHLQQPPANNTSMHEKLQSDPFNVPLISLSRTTNEIFRPH
jgi:hypothetical protein